MGTVRCVKSDFSKYTFLWNLSVDREIIYTRRGYSCWCEAVFADRESEDTFGRGLKWKDDHEKCGANSQDSYDEFLNKFIESDEEEDSGICYIWRQRFQLGSLNLIIVSCVTKVELHMPVVTAHSSYMYWGTLQRREARREGRELRGELPVGGGSSGEVEDSGRV